MKCLSIQLLPERDTSHDESEVIVLLKSLGHYPEIDSGNEDGRYLNLNFFTDDAPSLWQDIQSGVLEDKTLGSWIKNISIVICEGDTGWDDYLLLSHYDDSEELGAL